MSTTNLGNCDLGAKMDKNVILSHTSIKWLWLTSTQNVRRFRLFLFLKLQTSKQGNMYKQEIMCLFSVVEMFYVLFLSIQASYIHNRPILPIYYDNSYSRWLSPSISLSLLSSFHSVHWGYQSLLKNTTSLFFAKLPPPLNLHCPSLLPFQVTPPQEAKFSPPAEKGGALCGVFF